MSCWWDRQDGRRGVEQVLLGGIPAAAVPATVASPARFGTDRRQEGECGGGFEELALG
jgi:hypothetical protein